MVKGYRDDFFLHEKRKFQTADTKKAGTCIPCISPPHYTEVSALTLLQQLIHQRIELVFVFLVMLARTRTVKPGVHLAHAAFPVEVNRSGEPFDGRDLRQRLSVFCGSDGVTPLIRMGYAISKRFVKLSSAFFDFSKSAVRS